MKPGEDSDPKRREQAARAATRNLKMKKIAGSMIVMPRIMQGAEIGCFSHRKYAISTKIIAGKRDVPVQYSVQRKRNLSEKKVESKLA